jgi:hypothetical protein
MYLTWKTAAASVLVLGATAPKPAPKPAPKAPAKPVVGPPRFTPSEFDLAPGESYPVEVFVPSPSGKAVQGRLVFTAGDGITASPDPRWPGKVPAWGLKTYPRLTARADAAGDIPVRAALEGGPAGTLTVRVTAPTIQPVPERKQLTVKITNPFRKRLLHGRVIAANPDRFLQDVTTREFKLPPGQNGEVVFPLPGAAPAEGETYEFTLTVETYQGYRAKQTYPLSFPPQDPDE